jgi:hypothetical protein
MNFTRIYEYRFRGVTSSQKQLVWKIICYWLYDKVLNKPGRILDPAGGMCEFINNIQAKEKYTIDIEEEFITKHANPDVKIIIGSSLAVDLPQDNFDAVFISNFLEHLNTPEEVALLLERMFCTTKPNGRIVIMGPNFKYAFKNYFDFSDHKLIFTELSVAEQLYGAGYKIIKIIPRFLPLSFRSGSKFSVTAFTVKTYLNFPLLWKIFGKQFLVVGEKPE